MLRSLFSGISGLRAHQTMLDVTGNNIANVNTTGFKASPGPVPGHPVADATQGAGGAAGRASAAPTRPRSGLGVQVAGISTNFQQGASQVTGKADRHDDLRRRLLRHAARAASSSTRAPVPSPSTPPASSSRPDGGLVQGWAADGRAPSTRTAPLTDLRLPIATLMGAAGDGRRRPSRATCRTTPPRAPSLNRTVDVFDARGHRTRSTWRFTKHRGRLGRVGTVASTTSTTTGHDHVQPGRHARPSPSGDPPTTVGTRRSRST